MTNSWEILGGDILGDTGFQTGVLHIDEGRISNDPAKNMLPYNAENAWVLPGIVDLHGDGFEAIVEPRPGVHFPFDLAYREADRQMISNGITTGFHALTISWEPGLRDISVSRKLWSALHSISGSLDCDARFNLRWETFALDHVDEVIGWLSAQSGDILSINDHTTGKPRVERGQRETQTNGRPNGTFSRRCAIQNSRGLGASRGGSRSNRRYMCAGRNTGPYGHVA